MTNVDNVGSSNERCPECGGEVEQQRVDIVCKDCGAVVGGSGIDHGPEWRHFVGDKRRRTGAGQTVTHHDRGNGTVIGWSSTGEDTLSNGDVSKQRRLQSHQTSSRYETYGDRALAECFVEIRHLVDGLDLGDSIHEQSCTLFRRVYEMGLAKGRSFERLTAATVYAVCRQKSVFRRVEQLAEVSAASPSGIWKGYGVLQQELELSIPPQRPQEFVAQIGSEVSISPGVQSQALSLLENTDETTISGRSPSGLAASALVLAAETCSDNPPSRSAIGEAANIAHATLINNIDILPPLTESSFSLRD